MLHLRSSFPAWLKGIQACFLLATLCGIRPGAIADEPAKPTATKDPAISEIEVKNTILKSLDTVSVAAGVSGVLAEVIVREGDLVELQAPLARVRDDEAAVVVARAKLALSTAKMKASRDVDIKLAQKSTEVAEKELDRT